MRMLSQCHVCGAILLLVWWSIMLGGCVRRGVVGDPVAVVTLGALQIDAIQVAVADTNLALGALTGREDYEEFEVMLVDDVTGRGLYCSGRMEGMAVVRSVNRPFTNVGASFVPMAHAESLLARLPTSTVTRVRFELWERDGGECPSDPREGGPSAAATGASTNDLVAAVTMPAHDLVAAHDLVLDKGKVALTLSLPTPVPRAAALPISGLWLKGVTLGPFLDDADAPEIDVALFDAATSRLVACVGKSALAKLNRPSRSYTGLHLPLRFATGVDTIPELVRAAIVELDATDGCPAINVPAGDDVIVTSHRVVSSDLVGRELVMNDGVSRVAFVDAATVARYFDFGRVARLQVEKVRYADPAVSESQCLGCSSMLPEIEVVLFTKDHRPVACAGAREGLAPVDDPGVLYQHFQARLVSQWTRPLLKEDRFYWGLVERDHGTCPEALGPGDAVFATSAVHPLPALVNRDITFPGLRDAILRVREQE